MSLKIERNDSCPCGSGKKYKKCHLQKSDNPYNLDERKLPTLKQMMHEAELSECLSADQAHCSAEVRQPHPMTSHRLVANLLKKGHVIMPVRDQRADLSEVILTKVNQTEGKITDGFCQGHEKQLFHSIDSAPFDKSLEQLFFYNYRTFAKDYKEKLEAYRLQTLAFDYYHETNEKRLALESVDPQKLAVADNERDKKLFDKALEKGQFDIFETRIFELDYEVEILAANVLEVERDLEGQKINDIYSSNPDVNLGKLFMNVFPDEGKSYLIFSWFKRDANLYLAYAKQLEVLYQQDRPQFLSYLTNLIVKHSENIVIGSRLWEFWKTRGVERNFEKAWDDEAHRVVNPTLNRLYKGKELMDVKPYSLFESMEFHKKNIY